jgi:hypothetical protein
MKDVDRVALMVRAKEPYWAWARSLDAKAPAHERAVRDDHETVYLAEVIDDEALETVVEEHYEEIFTQELNSWYRREREWPSPRTLAMFRDWFEVRVVDLVIDLSDDE